MSSPSALNINIGGVREDDQEYVPADSEHQEYDLAEFEQREHEPDKFE